MTVTRKEVSIRALGLDGGHGWRDTTRSELRRKNVFVQIAVKCDDGSTTFPAYRPPRKRDETPIQYRKRTGCVDDRYLDRHQGWYYCNPVHCSRRWHDKAERDAHIKGAYACLD